MANQPNKIQCPVCSAPMSGAVCRACGYARMVFPVTVSDAVKDFEQQRLQSMRQSVNASRTRERELENRALAAEELARDLENRAKDAEKRERELDSRCRSLTADLADSRRRIVENESRLRAELEKVRSELALVRSASELLVKQERMRGDTLQNQVDSLQADIKKALGRAASLEQELMSERSAPRVSLAGVVVMEDSISHIKCVAPVMEGENSYGSSASSGSHHRLVIMARGISIEPIHFKVSTSARGLVVQPMPGAEISRNGMRLSSAVYAGASDIFTIAGRLHISISKV